MKEGDVTSVAFSPDGKTLAAGYGVVGGVGGVVLWDAAARKRLADEPLAVKEGDVSSVAFSPDGKTLAAGYGGVGGGGGGVVLWDAAARKRLAEDPLAVKEGDVTSVAFSPDGKTLAAGYGVGGGGGGVVLWDVDLESWQRHRRPDRQPQLHPGRMASVFPRRALPPDLPRPARSAGGHFERCDQKSVVLLDSGSATTRAEDHCSLLRCDRNPDAAMTECTFALGTSTHGSMRTLRPPAGSGVITARARAGDLPDKCGRGRWA